MTIVAAVTIRGANVTSFLSAGTTLQAHATHVDGSFWEHAPELIVVAVGFVAFMAYVWREQRNQQRRASSLPTVDVDGRQWLTVALLVISALGHLPVIPQHLGEAPYMGILFIAYAMAALGVAAGIAVSVNAARYAVAAALSAAAIAAYVATRLIGFPQLADDVGAWREPLGVLCVLAEAAVFVTAGMEWHRLTSRPHLGGGPVWPGKLSGSSGTDGRGRP